jgi:hypothetical protein
MADKERTESFDPKKFPKAAKVDFRDVNYTVDVKANAPGERGRK